MTKTHSRSFTRDNGDPVDVHFEFRAGTPESGHHGPPEHYDPGSPPEVDIVGVWRENSTVHEVRLDPIEVSRFVVEVMEAVDEYVDHGPDPDDWREAMMDEALEALGR